MSRLVVGVGDCRISSDPDTVLVTYALGSCIALAIHDPVAKVGGLLHFMLPESILDPDKAQRNPFIFADTGIPLLFQGAYELGGQKRRLVVAAAGGAQMMDAQGVFNVGKRNCLALRKTLWRAGVVVHAEDLGGLASRTVRLEVASGRVSLRAAGEREQDLLAAGSPAGRSF
jgi:chemotaxis protein CheD